jgi:hypothetical protein
MDPVHINYMTAGRKIRLHVELFEHMEYREGSRHICYDCVGYIEHPLLWFQEYRFYPYCTTCIRRHLLPVKIEVAHSMRRKSHARHDVRT